LRLIRAPSEPGLSPPWELRYNKLGAQIFYNRATKQYSYLHPVILKQLQAEGKTGRDLVITMYAKTGERYGVDYGFPPEGKIRWQAMISTEDRAIVEREALEFERLEKERLEKESLEKERLEQEG
jgi:hypothetical protein